MFMMLPRITGAGKIIQIAAVVPIAEYRQLHQAAQEQQINDEFDAARAEYLKRREAGTIHYVSHEEASRRLDVSSR
jgi:hypothetical protein